VSPRSRQSPLCDPGIDLKSREVDFYSRDGASGAIMAGRYLEERAATERTYATLGGAAESGPTRVKQCDCMAHTLSDSAKHAMKALGVDDLARARHSNNTLSMRLLETTIDFLRSNWTSVGVEEVSIDVQCTDTRFEAYFAVAAWLVTYRGLLLWRVFAFLGVAPDGSNLDEIVKKLSNNNAARALVALTNPDFLVLWAVFASLHHSIVRPLLHWAQALRGCRFDQLGLVTMDLVDMYASIRNSPRLCGFFENTFALTDEWSIDESCVARLVVSYVQELIPGYILDRANYLTQMPHSLSFLKADPARAQRYAASLLSCLNRAAADPKLAALLKLVEPLGLLHDKDLRGDLEAMTRGEKMSKRLTRRFYEIFGAYLVAQSGSERDVKVVKWILRQLYTRLEIVITRYRSFNSENDWDNFLLEAFSDDDEVISDIRKIIRESPITERDTRHEAQAVPLALQEVVDTLDLEELSKLLCGVMQRQKTSAASNTKARGQGVMTAAQVQLVATAGNFSSRSELQLQDGSECPCCGAREPTPCWPALSAAKDAQCGCKLCYMCCRVLSMSQKLAKTQLQCPACCEPITGVYLERTVGGKVARHFEVTPALPSAAAAEAEADENDDPQQPQKKKRKQAECTICRDAGLTTPASHKIGATTHNRPCPLAPRIETPETQRAATPHDPLANVGACTRASNAPKTRGPRIVLSF
jgi:hypothetical protein